MSKHHHRHRQKKIPRTARSAALARLGRIEQEGAYISLSRKILSENPLDARDERLANEYVAGITRWRRWLDFLITTFYRSQFDQIDIGLLHILRIGLYDILFLDTPPHAALYEAVELTKRVVGKPAGGVVNGVLRNILRQRDDLPRPDTGDRIRDLAIRFSHPTWMVRRWVKRYGYEETRELLIVNNDRPAYGLNINTLKIPVSTFKERLETSHIEWADSPYLDDFVRLKSLQPVLRSGWVTDGLCMVQDEGAGLVVSLLDPQSGETIIDACAAPGGKALLAARRMSNSGHLLAIDIHEQRLTMVVEAAERQGVNIIQTETTDLQAYAMRSDETKADRVLVDVPCSGLGVLSKRADLRWNRTREDLQELTVLQSALLEAAARLVRPGGLLVYSTCTIEPDENEEQITAFLSQHREYHIESAAGFVPPDLVTERGFYFAMRHRHGIDGAFGVRLRKRK